MSPFENKKSTFKANKKKPDRNSLFYFMMSGIYKYGK